MQGRLIAIALVALGGAAYAQTPAPTAPDPGSAPPPGTAPDPGSGTAPSEAATPPAAALSTPDAAAPLPEAEQAGDQAIAAEVGVAAGGRVTPGGLRLAGQFLYQLSDNDWFDGTASFTFGSGSAACFRDRENKVICSHGLAKGAGIELTASVRRMFAPRGAFQPFARIGVGIGAVRFDADDVSGITVPAHAGGGIRVAVARSIAIVAEGDLALGFGSFSRSVGNQVQFGLTIAAGAEFRLR